MYTSAFQSTDIHAGNYTKYLPQTYHHSGSVPEGSVESIDPLQIHGIRACQPADTVENQTWLNDHKITDISSGSADPASTTPPIINRSIYRAHPEGGLIRTGLSEQQIKKLEYLEKQTALLVRTLTTNTGSDLNQLRPATLLSQNIPTNIWHLDKNNNGSKIRVVLSTDLLVVIWKNIALTDLLANKKQMLVDYVLPPTLSLSSACKKITEHAERLCIPVYYPVTSGKLTTSNNGDPVFTQRKNKCASPLVCSLSSNECLMKPYQPKNVKSLLITGHDLLYLDEFIKRKDRYEQSNGLAELPLTIYSENSGEVIHGFLSQLCGTLGKDHFLTKIRKIRIFLYKVGSTPSNVQFSPGNTVQEFVNLVTHVNDAIENYNPKYKDELLLLIDKFDEDSYQKICQLVEKGADLNFHVSVEGNPIPISFPLYFCRLIVSKKIIKCDKTQRIIDNLFNLFVGNQGFRNLFFSENYRALFHDENNRKYLTAIFIRFRSYFFTNSYYIFNNDFVVGYPREVLTLYLHQHARTADKKKWINWLYGLFKGGYRDNFLAFDHKNSISTSFMQLLTALINYTKPDHDKIMLSALVKCFQYVGFRDILNGWIRLLEESGHHFSEKIKTDYGQETFKIKNHMELNVICHHILWDLIQPEWQLSINREEIPTWPELLKEANQKYPAWQQLSLGTGSPSPPIPAIVTAAYFSKPLEFPANASHHQIVRCILDRYYRFISDERLKQPHRLTNEARGTLHNSGHVMRVAFNMRLLIRLLKEHKLATISNIEEELLYFAALYHDAAAEDASKEQEEIEGARLFSRDMMHHFPDHKQLIERIAITMTHKEDDVQNIDELNVSGAELRDRRILRFADRMDISRIFSIPEDFPNFQTNDSSTTGELKVNWLNIDQKWQEHPGFMASLCACMHGLCDLAAVSGGSIKDLRTNKCYRERYHLQPQTKSYLDQFFDSNPDPEGIMQKLLDNNVRRKIARAAGIATCNDPHHIQCMSCNETGIKFGFTRYIHNSDHDLAQIQVPPMMFWEKLCIESNPELLSEPVKRAVEQEKARLRLRGILRETGRIPQKALKCAKVATFLKDVHNMQVIKKQCLREVGGEKAGGDRYETLLTTVPDCFPVS